MKEIKAKEKSADKTENSLKPTAPNREKSGFGKTLMLILSVIVLAVAAAFLFYPHKVEEFIFSYRGSQPTAVVTSSVKVLPTKSAQPFKKKCSAANDAILERLNVLETKLTDLEVNAGEDKVQAMEENAADKDDLTELNTKITLLEGKVMELESRILNTSYSTQQKALLVISTLALKEAALKGENFSAQIEAVTLLCDESTREKLKTIAPYAAGIKTADKLKDELPSLIRQAERISTVSSPNASLWAKAEEAVKSLVVIRKIDNSENEKGTDYIAKMAQAEKLAAKGELPAAAALLRGLPAKVALLFKTWTNDVAVYGRVSLITTDIINEALFSFAIADSDLSNEVQDDVIVPTPATAAPPATDSATVTEKEVK